MPSIPVTPEYAIEHETMYGRGPGDLIPGSFRLKKNLSNDYYIDRQLQKQQTFTGIEGINTQDMALQEGMGPIVDRSKEHLGTSDRAIIAMRQLLLEALDASERGETPRGLDPQTYRTVRALDSIPAVFGVTRDLFVVFSSNAFAVLGLRALYVLLAGAVDRFRYLRQGIALLLVFIGGKMLLSSVVELPVTVSLGAIVVVAAGAIAASLWRDRAVPT